jgi:hypothetical protein
MDVPLDNVLRGFGYGETVALPDIGMEYAPVLPLPNRRPSWLDPVARHNYYRQRLGRDDPHIPEFAMRDLIDSSLTPLMFRCMPHTDDRIVSPDEIRTASQKLKDVKDWGAIMPKEQAEKMVQEANELLAETKFPAYPCEVRGIQIIDLASLGWMLLYSQRLAFLGATVPHWAERAIVAAGGAKPDVVRVPTRDRLMDATLIVAPRFKLTSLQLEQIVAAMQEDGEKSLCFFPFKDQAQSFLETHQHLGLVGFFEGATGDALSAPGLRNLTVQSGLVSYTGSAISAAANLPDHRVNIVSMQTWAPMWATVPPEGRLDADAIRETQQRARIDALIQPVGRNLRPDGTDRPQYRVAVLHDPDIALEEGDDGKLRRAPQPPPEEVVRAVRNRTQPGRTIELPVTWSVAYVVEAVREFLETGQVTRSEPVRDREQQSRAQRDRETPEEKEQRKEAKRQERRNAVFVRLEELRSQGKTWSEAKRASGVQSPMQTWFSKQEQSMLGRQYRKGEPIDM